MQNDYKKKIVQFYEEEKRMPSYSEMMRLFGFKSKNAVYRLVEKLMDAGYVAKDHLGRLVPTDMLTEIPLLGLVKAGFPAPGDTLEDTIDLEHFLIPKKDKTFILKVDGDSMIDAHIAEGDLVIAEESNTAKNGDIVIAQVDGEFTMKYFKKEGSRVWLEPANERYAPINPEHSLEIKAIVKGVIRKY